MNQTQFEIQKEETSAGYTLYLNGQLDLSMAPKFRSEVEPLAAEADKTLVLNLKDLQYIDSTGLGLIISILKTRQEAGASLLIKEVPPKVQRLFDMTGISKFLSGDEAQVGQTGGKL